MSAERRERMIRGFEDESDDFVPGDEFDDDDEDDEELDDVAESESEVDDIEVLAHSDMSWVECHTDKDGLVSFHVFVPNSTLCVLSEDEFREFCSTIQQAAEALERGENAAVH